MLFLAPEGIVVSAFMFFANVFLAYVYREKYRPILHA